MVSLRKMYLIHSEIKNKIEKSENIFLYESLKMFSIFPSRYV